MRTIRGLSAALLPLALGCTSEPETKVVPATAVEHGEVLFHDRSIANNQQNTYSCATCHEISSDGSGSAILPGAPLAGAAARRSFWGGQEYDLLGAVNHCLYYFMLKAEPWTPDDVEARAMYAYIESLNATEAAGRAAPFTVVYTLADVPQGDAARGQVLYDRACAYCHGPPHTGEGRSVERSPVLPEQALAEHPLDKYTPADRRFVFIEKIRHGGFIGYGGRMPPFSTEKLSDQEVGDLLSFFGLD